MDILKFRVRGQALTLTNPNIKLIPVTDTVNQYLCQFEFSEDWYDLNKVVVFKNVSYNISKEVYLNTSNECYIPWEVLSNSGEIFLEVIGTEVRGEVVTVRIPSTLLGFKWEVQEGLLDVSANISPTPDLFEQFVSSVRSDSIVAATARDEAVIARDVAVQSAADASASELAATSAAESAVNSASTASSAASSASESALSVAGVADETKSYAEIASAKAADASTQAEIAAGAKEDAVTAKAGAEAARDEAATSAGLAQTTESHIKTMTVSAHSLAETEAPTVTKTDTSTGFALDFGIPKGATGPKGEDGDNIHYTWVKYADTPTSGMSDNPTGKAYIGIAYNKSTPVGSTVYSDYAWSRIKGEPGEDGYSPTVTTGTASDGSTTLTVTNKTGSTTTELVDGTARASVDSLSNSVSTRMSAIETEQSVQSARMDTFTSLPEGSTSGNAELADIRVGADGTTYDTAGNAVRGQIGELKSDLTGLQTVVDSKADKTELAKTNLYLDALFKLNKGQTWDTIESESEAYSVDVPSGSHYASVDMVGGKSVAWNQILSPQNNETVAGVTINTANGIASLNGTANANVPLCKHPIQHIDGHKYLFLSKVIANPNGITFTIGVGTGQPWITNVSSVGNYNKMYVSNYLTSLYIFDANGKDFSGVKLMYQLFDLTQMFGSTIADYIYSLEQSQAGAGVAWFKKLFPADYYPYSEPTIISSQTDRVDVASADGTITQQIPTGFPVLNSAGSVYDYVDLNEGKLYQRVGKVDLGTLTWTYDSTYAVFTASVNTYTSFPTPGPNNMGVCSKYLVHGSVVASELANYGDTIFICPYNWSSSKWLLVRDTSYTDATVFKTAMSGVMLYYELAEPVITDITIPTELSDWLTVEAGGSITFHNADDGKRLLIPNKETFIRKLDEVTV